MDEYYVERNSRIVGEYCTLDYAKEEARREAQRHGGYDVHVVHNGRIVWNYYYTTGSNEWDKQIDVGCYEVAKALSEIIDDIEDITYRYIYDLFDYVREMRADFRTEDAKNGQYEMLAINDFYENLMSELFERWAIKHVEQVSDF